MKDLKSAFAARDTAYCNRSSAIFALRLRPGTDLILSFLNYFKFKNGIKNVIANIRAYDADGALAFFAPYRFANNTNEYSMRQLMGKDHFDGMVDIEFITTENLKFPFPAVLGFYTAGKAYSSVHSAGRTKASNEAYSPFESEETNFTCKFAQSAGKISISPFIHIFNGPAKQTRNYTLRIRSQTGETLASKAMTFDFVPFASKIIEVASEFDTSLLKEGFFCSITAINDDIFPRFVCGNIHYENDFLETTHSYPVVHKPDYCESTEEKPLASLLPLLNHPKLSLSGIIFPTNIAASLSGRVLAQKFDEKKLSDTGTTLQISTGVGNGEIINCPADTAFMLIPFDSKEAPVPSRINISYRYRVKGSNSPYSTDIATGAKASVYPQKFTHWGAGVISTDYHPVVMIRNNSHNPAKTQDSNFTLTIYLGDKVFSHSFSMIAESATQLNLRDFIPANAYGAEPEILHWYLKSDQPVGETFWVSYSESGNICGDHGF